MKLHEVVLHAPCLSACLSLLCSSVAGPLLVYHWSITGLSLVCHWSVCSSRGCCPVTGLSLVCHYPVTGLSVRVMAVGQGR